MLRSIARQLLDPVLSFLIYSLRIKISGGEALEAIFTNNQRAVIAFWHGSMLLGWWLHRPRKENKVSCLISKSRDGEILAALLCRWNFSVVRGSSHIGGKEAMKLMGDAITAGASLCITPDGPTGPRHVMKMGAVRLAQKLKIPLFLSAVGYEKKFRFSSWDRFEVPYPFSRVQVKYSSPVYVPEEYSGELLDIFLHSIELQLLDLDKMANDFSGSH